MKNWANRGRGNVGAWEIYGAGNLLHQFTCEWVSCHRFCRRLAARSAVPGRGSLPMARSRKGRTNGVDTNEMRWHCGCISIEPILSVLLTHPMYSLKRGPTSAVTG